MWNSWSAIGCGAPLPPIPSSVIAPPLPTAPPPPMHSVTEETNTNTFIGPLQTSVISANTTSAYEIGMNNPAIVTSQYTQYAAAGSAYMTPQQQIQQWQAWQQYHRDLAKWEAQYGEQYKREMSAVAVVAPAIISQTSTPYQTYPPPQSVQQIVNMRSDSATGEEICSALVKSNRTDLQQSIIVQPQLYAQPPPPPLPQEEQLKAVRFPTENGDSLSWSAKLARELNQPPPNFLANTHLPPPPPPPPKEKSSTIPTLEECRPESASKSDTFQNPQRDHEVTHNQWQQNSFPTRTYKTDASKINDSLRLKDNCNGEPNERIHSVNNTKIDLRSSFFKQSGGFEPTTLQHIELNKFVAPRSQITQRKSSAPELNDEQFDTMFQKWQSDFQEWKRENASRSHTDDYKSYVDKFNFYAKRLMDKRDEVRRNRQSQQNISNYSQQNTTIFQDREQSILFSTDPHLADPNEQTIHNEQLTKDGCNERQLNLKCITTSPEGGNTLSKDSTMTKIGYKLHDEKTRVLNSLNSGSDDYNDDNKTAAKANLENANDIVSLALSDSKLEHLKPASSLKTTIPALDFYQQETKKNVSPSKLVSAQTASVDIRPKKIPSLFDVIVPKPVVISLQNKSPTPPIAVCDDAHETRFEGITSVLNDSSLMQNLADAVRQVNTQSENNYTKLSTYSRKYHGETTLLQTMAYNSKGMGTKISKPGECARDCNNKVSARKRRSRFGSTELNLTQFEMKLDDQVVKDVQSDPHLAHFENNQLYSVNDQECSYNISDANKIISNPFKQSALTLDDFESDQPRSIRGQPEAKKPRSDMGSSRCATQGRTFENFEYRTQVKVVDYAAPSASMKVYDYSTSNDVSKDPQTNAIRTYDYEDTAKVPVMFHADLSLKLPLRETEARPQTHSSADGIRRSLLSMVPSHCSRQRNQFNIDNKNKECNLNKGAILSQIMENKKSQLQSIPQKIKQQQKMTIKTHRHEAMFQSKETSDDLEQISDSESYSCETSVANNFRTATQDDNVPIVGRLPQRRARNRFLSFVIIPNEIQTSACIPKEKSKFTSRHGDDFEENNSRMAVKSQVSEKYEFFTEQDVPTSNFVDNFNNTVAIENLLNDTGRKTRAKNICVIMRGPPGCGKSYLSKLIKEKEVEMGGANPRILSIDDYFLVENDYEERCPKTGKKIPKKEILYEHDNAMEETYLLSLVRAFNKTISDHLYEFIIIDCNNELLSNLNKFYKYAKSHGYMPYIVDLMCDIETCISRNIHNRSEKDIKSVIENWEPTPDEYVKLDITSLLENVVEMEDAADMVTDSEQNIQTSVQHSYLENEESNSSDCGIKSKWEYDTTSENLARLDGTNKILQKNKTSMSDYLQLEMLEPPISGENSKKRVRWADIEERLAQHKMREIGFVVGQTDWKRMMDPQAGSRALNKTKYIDRVRNYQ